MNYFLMCVFSFFQCEKLLEIYEEDIEDWYFKKQGKTSLKQYICADKVLKGKDVSCLSETLSITNEKGDSGRKSKKKKVPKSKPPKEDL